MKKIPTEKEWFGYQNDIDARYAHKIFYGKSNEEMQSALRDNVLERVDEIRFMPIGAFQYYIFGLRDYVIRQNFGYYDASDSASCFLGLILEKLQKSPEYILPVIPELMADIEFVVSNQDIYEADEEIYGDFKNLYQQIVMLVNRNSYQ